MQFSRAVSVDEGVVPDDGFEMAGVIPGSITAAGADTVIAAHAGPPLDGDPWTLTAWPNWLITEPTVPQSGTIA